jgi:hypothetical protein
MSHEGGVGEESQQNEDENYEGEAFEYEDKSGAHMLPVVIHPPQIQHHYMQPT